MAKTREPVTPATRMLRKAGVDFEGHLYAYEEKGGTAVSARELGIDEHRVIKTLVFESEAQQVFLVLMHGDRQVSTKSLAREIGVKSVLPCPADRAQKFTGYLFGGTSPFGTRRDLPVYLEKSILELPEIYLNGGKRGFLIRIAPHEVVRLLNPTLVEVALD